MENSVIGADWVGKVIDDKFTLLEWLGGDTGSGVFRTELQEGPRTQNATIKIISADGMEAESLLAGWAASMKLSHDHLVPVFRTGRCQIGYGSNVYVVSEYAEEVLSQLLPERPMAPGEAMDMLGPTLDALDYLHRSGFVHGHLKPANILVINDQLKISGDGLHEAGKFRKSPSTLTVYDAPELAISAVSPTGDLWSLGITLVEALTQQTPLVDPAASQDPDIPDSIPEPFAEIVRHCLRRKPSQRWRIVDIKAHLDPSGSRPVASEAEATEMAGPAKTRFAVAVVLGLVVAAAIAVFFLHPHTTEPSVPGAAESSAPASESVSPQTPAPDAGAAPSAASPAQQKLPTTGSAAPSAASPARPSPTPAQVSAPSTSTPAPTAPAPETKSSHGPAAKGEVAQRAMPDVPHKSLATIEGKFESTVRVNVDAQGDVTDTSLQSPGPSKYFANLALEASRKWKFKPAQSGGHAVASVWTLRYTFRRSGPEVTAVEVSP